MKCKAERDTVLEAAWIFLAAIVAGYLRDHTNVGDRIAVLRSEPQIYFYSKRHSATGYIYTYGLMEPQSYARQMQEEMIFAWADDYVKKFDEVVGLVDILSGDYTDYYFDQLPSPMPPLGNYILICRRKS